MRYETHVVKSPFRLAWRDRVRKRWRRWRLRRSDPQVATAVEAYEKEVSTALWGDPQ